MLDIIEIQEQLLATNRELARFRATASQFPGSVAFIQMMESVERRRDKLEGLLRKAAEECGREVCEYRFLPAKDSNLTLAGFSDTLGGFQKLLTVTYEAVLRGQRHTGHVGKQATQATDLDFAYTMAGSVIFVFTLSVQKTLIEDPLVEDTIKAIFGASKANSSNAIRDIAKELGPAPVKTLYGWARAHAMHRLAADIVWQPGSEKEQSIELNPHDFDRLVEVIGEVSEETSEEVVATGNLVGADTSTRKFHFQPDGGDDIRGDLGDSIGPAEAVVVNVRYRARFGKFTQRHYATNEEKITYTLLSLDRLGSARPEPARPLSSPAG